MEESNDDKQFTNVLFDSPKQESFEQTNEQV